MPEFKKETANTEKVSLVSRVDNSNNQNEKDWTQSPWDDEESRSFYCDIPDLKNVVPMVYLSEEKKKKKKKTHKKQKQEDDYDDFEDEDYLEHVDEEALQNISKKTSESEEAEDINNTNSKNIVSVNITPAIDNLLSNLQNLISQPLIDKAVIEYITITQSHRLESNEALLQLMMDLPRYRLDVLPYFARFVRGLYEYLPDIGNTLVVALHLEFKRLFRRHLTFHLEKRVKNIRFIGELIKFGICPTHVGFYCFSRLVKPETSGHTFSNHHAEVTCNLLETCGKYFLKTPETSKNWSLLVDIFEKKCKSFNLDSRVAVMVENALIAINPPSLSSTIKPPKLKTPCELFIRKLLMVDLNSKSVDKAIRLLRCLKWDGDLECELWDFEKNQIKKPDDKMVVDENSNQSMNVDEKDKENSTNQNKKVVVNYKSILTNICRKIWKFKFHNVRYVAEVVSGLSRYHDDFGISIVDSCLEEIRVGLEDQLHYSFHQRRLVVIHYLGELYNCCLLPTNVILDTLYSFIWFGHVSTSNGRFGKLELRNNELDRISDFFRIRCVCTLLETSGVYLRPNGTKNLVNWKKTREFLAFFQLYVLTKVRVLEEMREESQKLNNETDEKPPTSIENQRSSTFKTSDWDLLPVEILFLINDTFDLFSEHWKRCGSLEEAESQVEVIEREKGIFKDGSVYSIEDDRISTVSNDDSDISDDSDSLSDDSDTEDDELDIEDDEKIIVKKVYVPPQIETEEFDLEFQKVLNESIESRRHEKRNLDVAIPMQLKSGSNSYQSSANNNIDSNQAPNSTEVKQTMQFTLLTKSKGNTKPKILDVPTNSSIAIRTREKQKELLNEQNELKKLVLDYEVQSKNEDTRNELEDEKITDAAVWKNTYVTNKKKAGGGGTLDSALTSFQSHSRSSDSKRHGK